MFFLTISQSVNVTRCSPSVFFKAFLQLLVHSSSSPPPLWTARSFRSVSTYLKHSLSLAVALSHLRQCSIYFVQFPQTAFESLLFSKCSLPCDIEWVGWWRWRRQRRHHWCLRSTSSELSWAWVLAYIVGGGFFLVHFNIGHKAQSALSVQIRIRGKYTGEGFLERSGISWLPRVLVLASLENLSCVSCVPFWVFAYVSQRGRLDLKYLVMLQF